MHLSGRLFIKYEKGAKEGAIAEAQKGKKACIKGLRIHAFYLHLFTF